MTECKSKAPRNDRGGQLAVLLIAVLAAFDQPCRAQTPESDSRRVPIEHARVLEPEEPANGASWDWWWECNDKQFIWRAAERSALRERALMGVQRGFDDPYFDTRAAVAMSAAKLTPRDSPSAPAVRAQIRSLLTDPDNTVRESAYLALGILGDASQVPDLLRIFNREVVAESAESRPSLRVRVREQAFSGFGIGLIGMQQALEPSFVMQLVDCAVRETAPDDLRVAAVWALSLAGARSSVPALERLAKNAKDSELVRAHAIVALAKLGDKELSEWLTTSGFNDRSKHVRRSSAIALGLLARASDQKVIEALIWQAGKAADRACQNFSLIALGQIGGVRARDYLVYRLKSGRSPDRTFSALGLGVNGRLADRDDRVGDLLLNQWIEDKDDANRGAYAISMGLIGFKKAVPALIEALKADVSPDLKGHVATALGLLGAKEATAPIRAIAMRAADLDSQRRASIALGLIGDSDAPGLLLNLMKESGNNTAAFGLAAVALGFIGSEQAVTPLSDVVTKRGEYKDNPRAFAAVALGIIGDKGAGPDGRPVLTALQQDSNYLARTPAFSEIQLIY